jgi:hypothetical protein
LSCGPSRSRSLPHLSSPPPPPPSPSPPKLVRVYLCDEMASRMADTLNYFLIYLTGPKRRELKVRRAQGEGGGGRSGRCQDWAESSLLEVPR